MIRTTPDVLNFGTIDVGTTSDHGIAVYNDAGADGKEILYVTADGKMMSVSVDLDGASLKLR